MSVKITSYYSGLLGIFAFLMLVFPKMIALGFILFLPFIVWGLIRKSIRFEWSWLNTAFVSLYLVYAVYVLFTRHTDWANTYLENKLSFFLLPLLLAFRPKEKFDFSLPIGLYLLGAIVLLVQGYAASLSKYNTGLGINSFLTSEFSIVHHPTYFSVYLLLAIILCIYALRNKLPGFKPFWVYPLCLVFFIAYFQCLSLAGMLFGMALSGFLFIRFIYLQWGKAISALSLVFVFLASYLAVNYVPQIEGEWSGAMWYAKEYMKDPETYVRTQTTPESGSQERLIMWTVAGKAIAAYPMGVGTGNVDEVLGGFLRRFNQHQLAEKELNPHNQYLQTAVETGIFGLLILLAVLFTAFRAGLRRRNWILLIMTAGLAFNMLFESMLQRQSGIVFYTFILVLLAYYPFQKQEQH